MKLISLASVATAIVAWLVFAGYSVWVLDMSWALRLFILGVMIALISLSEWVLWGALQPPVLRCDGMEVTCVAGLDHQRMQRSDLAFIFRGQFKPRAQRRGPWARSYIFAAADGRVGITCSPLIFSADGMAQFAQRLHLPIRGDFSVQVSDRVDPSAS